MFKLKFLHSIILKFWRKKIFWKSVSWEFKGITFWNPLSEDWVLIAFEYTEESHFNNVGAGKIHSNVFITIIVVVINVYIRAQRTKTVLVATVVKTTAGWLRKSLVGLGIEQQW